MRGRKLGEEQWGGLQSLVGAHLVVAIPTVHIITVLILQYTIIVRRRRIVIIVIIYACVLGRDDF